MQRSLKDYSTNFCFGHPECGADPCHPEQQAVHNPGEGHPDGCDGDGPPGCSVPGDRPVRAERQSPGQCPGGLHADGGRGDRGTCGVHGFGLARIDRIVSKYGGFLNRQDKEGVFETEVMLRLVEG